MLTILFATRNRARVLADVLTAYERLESPTGGWKLVIVDNGSADASREVVARYEGRLPLVLICEPKPGKNAALNTGLEHVSGDLVVFTDDDVYPRPDWLLRLRDAADAHPEAEIFGGRVLPRWEIAPPPWLVAYVPLAPTFTISDANQTEGPMDAQHVFGPNMAVRRKIFEAGNRFDPHIGPSNSGSYAMGSETEFVLRLTAAGARAYSVPSAIVEHFVRKSQMRLAWIIGRAARFGRGQCLLYRRFPSGSEFVWGIKHPAQGDPGLLGIPFPLLYQAGRKVVGLMRALLSGDKKRAFMSIWSLSFLYGYARSQPGRHRRGNHGP